MITPFPRRKHRPAFTLIELLVVIAVIGILAAMTVSITGKVDRDKKIKTARVELTQIETAIAAYKAKLSSYPPDNGNDPVRNPLYFELSGTTNNGTVYRTLDGSSQVISPVDLQTLFGAASSIAGFVNSSTTSSGDDTRGAVNFLKDFRPNQIVQTRNNAGQVINSYLVCSVKWTGPQPLIALDPTWNPWQYNSSRPTHNPSSYDLWVDLYIRGKIYRISNWSKTP